MVETRWKYMHKSDSSNPLGERRMYKTSAGAGKSNKERRDTQVYEQTTREMRTRQ
jgi:endonuclease IV